MRDFIKRALKKLNKLTPEQTEDLVLSAATEIDRLETVLESLTEGILVCDTRHSLVMANKYAERFLPIALSESGAGAQNEPIWTRVKDEKVADFFEATLLSGDRAEEREFNVDAKGKMRLLSLSILPLVNDRHVTGSLIYVEDITDKRNKEARLRRAENLASLTTLAAGVAHEIKNPLGSISIHIQLIQKALVLNRELFKKAHPDGADDIGQEPYFDQLDKYIGVVNEEIDRLNHIVVDFLFAVRPMDLNLGVGNINTLLAELTDFVRYELEESRIKCLLELDEDLPLLNFDERFLKQAFLNLIKNAAAAMGEGGILTVKTKKHDAEALISIQDTGTGIPEENLSKIFEPYFTTKPTGSGLGLTLVFKIIREHLGEISVKSREGEGSVFTITLPIPQKERRLIGFDAAPNT
ncbi:PAS domain-containing sensor histidine kinase [Spirochaetia bacterium]|nr:PAS domain-containing sensor histidine kinase [Spirochaetia bacterium]